MEELKNWQSFNLINQSDIESAFQRMCTYLFCYTYEVENLSEEPNHPGIETYPVIYKGKNYGFQSKYFSSRTEYAQIDKSVETLLKSSYKSQVDVLVLYCNRKFSECNSFKEIKKKLTDSNIELMTVCDEEILRQISLNKYYVIYNLFFRKSSILDNYKFQTSSNEEIDEIINNHFIDLSLNDLRLSAFLDKKINEKTVLIEGDAGSGKSVAMYYLYRQINALDEDKYNQAAKLAFKKHQTIYINFKTHPHDCKMLINNIIKEIETNFNNHKVTILFDGFDEISDSYAREMSIFIDEICHKDTIDRIFISCRSLSLKKHYLVHNISDLVIYKITPLSKEDKLNYAKSTLSNNDLAVFEKLIDTNELLSQVDDPLCLKYVIDNIPSIETSTDLFDLVKMTIEKNLGIYINELKILEPKIENTFLLISYIAFKIYNEEKNYISIYDLNNIVKTLYPKLNYDDINKFVNALKSCGLLIECADGLTFKHKRIFEYFLIEYIYNKYLQDIKILQEVNIFKQEDLFDNLFLNKLKKNINTGAPLNLVAEYNLFETYMNKNHSFGADENSIMYSNFFADALCSFDDQTIIDIMEVTRVHLPITSTTIEFIHFYIK